MSQEIGGNIYQKIIEQRMNILKGFTDYKENTDSTEELEKAEKFDNSTQRTYADNPENRKLNRVGQKYGGRNIKESDSEGKGNQEEDTKEGVESSEKQPQEVQPNQTYESEQLQEFASEAENWQLQEFIKDAKASGDNSEYMQSQIRIAENELKNREVPTADIGEGADVDATDLNNVENAQDGENTQDGENGSPDWNDVESVKKFLGENPEIRNRWMAMVEEDIFTRPVDLLKIAAAESKSSNEALQTVQEAKNMLDELHSKLGGVSESDSQTVSFESDGSVAEAGKMITCQVKGEDEDGNLIIQDSEGNEYNIHPDEIEAKGTPDEEENSSEEESSSQELDEENFDNLGTYEKAEISLGKADIGAKASGGGYTYTKKGKNHWISNSGVTKNDAAVSDMIAGFGDFKIK